MKIYDMTVEMIGTEISLQSNRRQEHAQCDSVYTRQGERESEIGIECKAHRDTARNKADDATRRNDIQQIISRS